MTDPSQLAVDHALIVHDDLDASAATLARMGFRPTPPGFHGQSLGTANVTIMLPDRRTYFEVIVAATPTERNADKRQLLDAHGPHLFGLAFKGDARAAEAAFVAAGVSGGPAFDFDREVALADGPATARFAIAQTTEGALPGLYAFVCQHFSPNVVWRPDYLDHPNGAGGLVGLWGVSCDPAAHAPAWRALFGDRVSAGAGVLHVATPTAGITWLSPEGWAEHFGLPLPDRDPGLALLEVSVADLSATRRHLDEAGLAVRETAGGLLVADAHGLGTALLFSHAAAT